jgi:hypothetical protein
MKIHHRDVTLCRIESRQMIFSTHVASSGGCALSCIDLAMTGAACIKKSLRATVNIATCVICPTTTDL